MWNCLDAVDEAGNGCNEDRAGVSGATAWVLDGAASVFADRVTDHPESDAVWLVDHLTGHLTDRAGDTDQLDKVVANVIRDTAADAEQAWSPQREFALPSAAMGVVRREGPRTEFLVLADVSVIMKTPVGVYEFIDQRVDHYNRPAYDAMVEHLQRPDATFASTRECTRPLLAEARLNMNQEGGYWVASIDDRAVGNALTGGLDGVTDVILASDGFMRAVHLFGLLPDVAALFDCDDLGEVGRAVRAAERADPDIRAYPRWSVSDDMRALRLDCERHDMVFPEHLAITHLDLKSAFGKWKNRKRVAMQDALELLDLPQIGHPHRGMDDARTLARLTKATLPHLA